MKFASLSKVSLLKFTASLVPKEAKKFFVTEPLPIKTKFILTQASLAWPCSAKTCLHVYSFLYSDH